MEYNLTILFSLRGTFFDIVGLRLIEVKKISQMRFEMQDPVILIPVLLVVLIMTGCILAGLDHFDGEEDNSYPDHNGI